MLELHRRAVALGIATVDLIRPDQWELPTPCPAWTVRELVEHMTVENGIFATALGQTPVPTDGDPQAAHARSAEQVVTAFAKPGALDGSVKLPQVHPAMTFPAAQALSFHLLDYVVHCWDVAVASGQSVSIDDDLVQAVIEIADREVPNGERRLRPNASFKPSVSAPQSASALDDLLAMLGRSPRWPH